jgi:hypothetical protein
MSKISYVKDVIDDSIFAVLIENNNSVSSFGVNPTAVAWAKQANARKHKLEDIKKNIDVMLYVSQPKNLSEVELDSLASILDVEATQAISAFINTPVKKAEIKTKSEQSSFGERAEQYEPEEEEEYISLSDLPMRYVDVQFKKNAVIYKTKAFSLDRQISSLRLEAKGARAVFDPTARDGVGAWRCPQDTPYGGQFTNRFGRGCTWGVSRRIGRAFTAFAGDDLGKIRKIGETLEDFGNTRASNAAERSGRRLERRARSASKPPARERVAERFATTLENAAGGVRARSANRIQRRTDRRTGSTQAAKAPKQKLTETEKFFQDLKKRNSKLSLEKANQIFDTSDPSSTAIIRVDGTTDSEWSDTIEAIVGDNTNGDWVAIPDDQFQYVFDASRGTVTPNKRDFRKAIAKHREDNKPQSKRSQRGSAPKKAPLAERLAERMANAADSVRKPGTSRKERGRKPRSTQNRRERAGRVLSQTANRVLTGEKKPKKDKTKKRSARATRRDVVLGGNSSAKFFAKTGIKPYMPDMNTLPQQTQDDVKAAVQKEYEELYDVWEKRTLAYIDRYKKSRRAASKPKKFKSSPGNLVLEEVIEANTNSGIIDGYMQGQWNNDAHNFEVLSEIVSTGDYSKVDELKPSKRDKILIAAGITPPQKSKRKPKSQPATPAPVTPTPQAPTPSTPAPQTPTPATAPTPPTPPAAPPTPPTPPAAPPAPPTPPTPPAATPVNINPRKPVTPTPPPKPPAPVPPAKPEAPKNRDLSIPGVQPAGSTWMGQDVSGFVKIDIPGANPIFLDPESNRFVDLSDNIEIDNPAKSLPRISYPKVSKTPLIKYPSKRDPDQKQNREIFPGVSDKAWDSWTDSVQQFPADVSGHSDTIYGFQTVGEYIAAALGVDELKADTPLAIVDGTKASSFREFLDGLHLFLQPQWGDKPVSAEELTAIGYDYDLARAAMGPGTATVGEVYSDAVLNLPISGNPWEGWNAFRYKGARRNRTSRAFSSGGARWGQSAPPSKQVSHALIKALVTGNDTDYITAFDTLTSNLQNAQQEMKNLITRYRTPGNKQGAVATRRMAQLGFEIDALEKMADRYFSDDKIAAAVTRKTRATYKRGIDAANKQRERAERRASGELKVGGKLQLEDLKPKEGIVRDGDTLRRLLDDHVSPQLFSEINLLDSSQAVPLLTEDEIDYLDQVQNAYLSKALPDGTVVDWSDSATNASIAELYMAMDLNGYNDLPVQVSTEEAEQMLREKDSTGKPRWFIMSRYVDSKKSKTGKTEQQMVSEYVEGTRFPVGQGASYGGRGDNFAGGAGYNSYGPGAIIALVSADTRIADKKFLERITLKLQDALKEMAQARQVALSNRLTLTPGEVMDIDEFMGFVDTLKTNIDFSSSRFPTGSPISNETRAIVTTLMEHWLQLEISKIESATNPDDIEWNNRLTRMQTGMYNMDEAQIALFAGYAGYFSETPTWLTGTAEHSTWAENTGRDFGQAQVIWLNRTALTVLDRMADHTEATRLNNVR